MELIVGGERARVADPDLLGEGGEARVYGWKELALKIFHRPGPDAVSQRACGAEARQADRLSLRAPTAGGGPQGAGARPQGRGGRLRDGPGAGRGGRQGCSPTARWRETAVSNEQVGAFFRTLAQGLSALHAAKVVVGDLNDGNVLVPRRGAVPHRRRLDAVRRAALPGRPRALPRPAAVRRRPLRAPRASTRAPTGTPSRCCSFPACSTCTRSAACTPRCARSFAAPRRATASSAPTSPGRSSAVHPRVLPDDVIEWFLGVFEQDARGPAPDAVLRLAVDALQPAAWSTPARVCPQCQALGQVRVAAVRAPGPLHLRAPSFTPAGQVLAAALQGGLRYVYEEEGVLRREDGARCSACRSPPARAWCPPGTPPGWPRPTAWCASRTGASSSARPPRCAAVRAGVRRLGVGRVATRRAAGWSTSTPARASARCSRDRPGCGPASGSGSASTARAASPSRSSCGSAAPAWCRSSCPPSRGGWWRPTRLRRRPRAALAHHRARGTRDRLRCYLFDASGKRLAQASGPASERMFQSPRSRALMAGRVVCATDDGLLSLCVDRASCVEGRLFVDTQSFVGAGDELLAQPDGSLYVVGSP